MPRSLRPRRPRLSRSPQRVAGGALVVVTALVAAATAPATGASAQPNQAPAAQARIAAEPRAGAAPVPLTPAQRAGLLKAAANSAKATAGSLKLGAKEKLLPKDVVKDADGTVHTRYERTYAGLPVIGGDLVVHERGAARTVTKASDARCRVPTTKAAVTAATAKKSALAAAKTEKTDDAATDASPKLVVWLGRREAHARLADRRQRCAGRRNPEQPERGDRRDDRQEAPEFEQVHSGTGHSQYSGEVRPRHHAQRSLYRADRPRARRPQDVRPGRCRRWHRRRSSPTTTTSGATATAANRQTAAVDAAYGAAEDVGLLPRPVRPQRHR